MESGKWGQEPPVATAASFAVLEEEGGAGREGGRAVLVVLTPESGIAETRRVCLESALLMFMQPSF